MTPNQAIQRSLEIILVLIAVALTCLLHQTTGYKVIVLNLFYLPVILAAFFLGRYRAGVLAFFCVIAASLVTAFHLGDFAPSNSPLIIGLSVVVWGAVLGLAALLVGTLSDELSSQMAELHRAHVQVVEVLSRYLQSADPRRKERSQRIADLCQEVAQQLKLSIRNVDDIRVAALLYDVEDIEITARVTRRALGEHKGGGSGTPECTFHGSELVQSLGPALLGALPLVLNQTDAAHEHEERSSTALAQGPLGARVIRTVRAYDDLLHGRWGLPGAHSSDVLQELQRDTAAAHDPKVLRALERVVQRAR